MADEGNLNQVNFTTATGMPFPEGFKKDALIPLWWRRISSQVFDADKMEYARSGYFPADRAGVEERIRELLEDEFIAPSYRGHHPKPAFLAVLGAMERKLTFIMKLVLAEVPRLTPGRMRITPQGVSFWDDGSALAINDVLEMQIPLFAEYPLLIRCYARVVLLKPDVARGMVQVVCRYELAHATSERKTKPALVFEAPKEKPRVPPPEPVSVKVPPPPPEPEAPPGGVPHQIEPHDIVSAGHRANNRRQSFRINGVVLMAWRLVEPQEFAEILSEYRKNHKLRPRDFEYRYQERIIALDFHLQRLAEIHPKIMKTLYFMRSQVDLLCRRANTVAEEEYYLGMMKWLQVMLEELAKVELSQRLTSVILAIKLKLELKLEWGRIDFRTDHRKKQEIPLQLKKVGREIEKGMAECEGVGTVFSDAVSELVNLLEVLDSSADDRHADGDAPMGTMISRSVNLSVTGLAFRTKKQDIKNGDIVEFELGLVPEGDVPLARESRYCYGKVVLLKGPDIEKSIRVATEFVVLPLRIQEEIYSFMAQLQRDRLATRIETSEF